MRYIIIIVLALASLAFMGATCAPSEYGQASWGGVEQERAQLGLPSLAWDDGLAGIANARAGYLADNTIFTHEGWQDYWLCVPVGTRIAELLGRQPLMEQPDAVWYGWQYSPIHYAQVISPVYRYAGFAAYVGSDGWVYEALWMSSQPSTCVP